jgi:hypothetical protein
MLKLKYVIAGLVLVVGLSCALLADLVPGVPIKTWYWTLFTFPDAEAERTQIGTIPAYPDAHIIDTITYDPPMGEEQLLARMVLQFEGDRDFDIVDRLVRSGAAIELNTRRLAELSWKTAGSHVASQVAETTCGGIQGSRSLAHGRTLTRVLA